MPIWRREYRQLSPVVAVFYVERKIRYLNIEEKLSNSGLSREQYESALKDICDKVNGLNDMDWVEIRDKYHLDCHPDSLKKSSHTPFGGPFVKAYMDEKYASAAPSSYIEQMEQLRKEKQKLFDERVALKKMSREEARGEVNYSLLESMIRANGENVFSPILLPVFQIFILELMQIAQRVSTILTSLAADYNNTYRKSLIFKQLINHKIYMSVFWAI